MRIIEINDKGLRYIDKVSDVNELEAEKGFIKTASGAGAAVLAGLDAKDGNAQKKSLALPVPSHNAKCHKIVIYCHTFFKYMGSLYRHVLPF